MKEFVTLTRHNIRVWLLLAFQAGAINAGGFIVCKRFVTHTTGFATHFAYELAQDDINTAMGLLSVPVFFLLGTMITSYFVDLPVVHHRKPNFRVPAVLIFLTVLAATVLGELGVFGVFGETMRRDKDYYFMVLLCLASGLQNALITNASGVVVRTTHLTGVTTDLGAGLVRLLFSDFRRDPHHVRKDQLASLARFGIIGAFVLGSTISALIFFRAEYLGFLLPVFTSLILMRYFFR